MILIAYSWILRVEIRQLNERYSEWKLVLKIRILNDKHACYVDVALWTLHSGWIVHIHTGHSLTNILWAKLHCHVKYSFRTHIQLIDYTEVLTRLSLFVVTIVHQLASHHSIFVLNKIGRCCAVTQVVTLSSLASAKPATRDAGWHSTCVTRVV
jgi:hypothetical protein